MSTDRTPVCSCRNEGKAWERDGVTYISWDPGCRVHERPLSHVSQPLSAETIVGNWQEREKVDE